MADYENILSFRPLEPRPPRSDACIPTPSVSREAPADDEPAASGGELDRCVVPWAKRFIPRPFAWQDLRGEQPLSPVRVCLGKSLLSRVEVSPLTAGSIVTLDRATDDPVEIVVGGKVVALGRLVVAQNNQLAIEVSQVRRVLRAGAA